MTTNKLNLKLGGDSKRAEGAEIELFDKTTGKHTDPERSEFTVTEELVSVSLSVLWHNKMVSNTLGESFFHAA